jgi:hypothetical protein
MTTEDVQEMLDGNELVSWMEPDDGTDEPIIWFAHAKDLVLCQKEVAKAVTRNPAWEYDSDKDALEDFIVIHWCERTWP